MDIEENFPLSVISVDINGLKIINDSLGHIEGNRLLVAAANIIKSCCKEEDILARIGRDEFYILFPNTDSKVSKEFIMHVNKKCKKYNKNNTNYAHYLSISLGAATKTSEEESFEDILILADDAMYRDKILKKKGLGDYAIFSMEKILFKKLPQARS